MLAKELRVAVSLGALLLVSACSSESEDDAALSSATGICPAGWQSALNDWGEVGFSGTVVYAERGSVVCSVAYGRADRDADRSITTDTVFSIGSITKTFTAAAILKLVDEERFALSDLAGALLPGLSGPAADASIEQLLSHTSGLQGVHSEDFVPMDAVEAIAAISALGSAFEPGTDNLYSNSGYSVLALIVNEFTGSYRDYIADEILTLPNGERVGGFWSGEPAAAGPRAYGYFADGSLSEQLGDFTGPHWAFDGNGGMAMTGEQLAMWTQALSDGEIISPGAVETMTSMVWDNGDGTSEALGWVRAGPPIFERTVLGASGSSSIIKHEVTLTWQPETNRILVVANNANDGPFIDDQATFDVFDSDGPIAGPPALSPEDAAFIESVSGRYTTGSEHFIVGRLDGGLVIAADGAETIASLFPPGDLKAEFDAHNALVTAFFNGESEVGRAEIEIFRDDDGNPPRVTMLGAFLGEAGVGTAVEINSGREMFLGLYRLNSADSIIYALAYTKPAPLDVMPVVPLKREGDQWVPAIFDWPIASISVSFDNDGSMTVTGPDGAIRAFPK